MCDFLPVAGAAIAGGTHYVATAKRLVEEGVAPTQRVKAMPVAVGFGLLMLCTDSSKVLVANPHLLCLQLRALGVSTVICTAVGAAAFFAFQQCGINAKPVADVASLHETITLAKHQRVRIVCACCADLHCFTGSHVHAAVSIADCVCV